MLKPGDYVAIQAFMRTELDLKGTELVVYALIFGFSKDGVSWFEGSASYIAEWAGVARTSVMNALKSLTSKGLIEKRVKTVHGIRFCDYRVSKNCTTPCSESGQPPCAESERQSIGLENIEESGKRKRFTPPTVEEMAKYMNESGHIVNAEKFIDFYGSKGWRVGNSPMKDWRAAVRNWERGQTEEQREADRAWLAAWRKRHEPRKTNTGRWMLDGKQIDPPEGESGYRLDGTWVGESDIQETSAPVAPPQEVRRGMVTANDLFGGMFR